MESFRGSSRGRYLRIDDSVLTAMEKLHHLVHYNGRFDLDLQVGDGSWSLSIRPASFGEDPDSSRGISCSSLCCCCRNILKWDRALAKKCADIFIGKIENSRCVQCYVN